mmetsp:Transcript_42045/g.89529  ORF Transcript_42045/g.89529 Transcript_42045/m.89529 type:complete len:201 (-) Transcript_42045:244-846(-)
MRCRHSGCRLTLVPGADDTEGLAAMTKPTRREREVCIKTKVSCRKVSSGALCRCAHWTRSGLIASMPMKTTRSNTPAMGACRGGSLEPWALAFGDCERQGDSDAERWPLAICERKTSEPARGIGRTTSRAFGPRMLQALSSSPHSLHGGVVAWTRPARSTRAPARATGQGCGDRIVAKGGPKKSTEATRMRHTDAAIHIP